MKLYDMTLKDVADRFGVEEETAAGFDIPYKVIHSGERIYSSKDITEWQDKLLKMDGTTFGGHDILEDTYHFNKETMTRKYTKAITTVLAVGAVAYAAYIMYKKWHKNFNKHCN